jgi:DNA-directed RNA polymerase I, II, and III subunit RPABC2
MFNFDLRNETLNLVDDFILDHIDDFSEEDDEDDDEDIDENYLQKLDKGIKNNIISEYHPELMVHNMDEVEAACVIVRDSNGVIVDRMHKTLPFVTRYEKARVLGERAKQINAGAKPFIEISDSLIDGYLIALKEFEQKKIPFIVRRPLPNGGSEYWKLRDLEILE